MTAAIENYGVDPVREAMDSLGGWPVVVGDNWDNTTFDWIDVTERIRKLGFRADMFVQFKVIADVLNNTKKVLFVSSNFKLPFSVKKTNINQIVSR